MNLLKIQTASGIFLGLHSETIEQETSPGTLTDIKSIVQGHFPNQTSRPRFLGLSPVVFLSHLSHILVLMLSTHWGSDESLSDPPTTRKGMFILIVYYLTFKKVSTTKTGNSNFKLPEYSITQTVLSLMIFVIVAFASHTNGKISLPRDLS
jgi:hypothetical protein